MKLKHSFVLIHLETADPYICYYHRAWRPSTYEIAKLLTFIRHNLITRLFELVWNNKQYAVSFREIQSI